MRRSKLCQHRPVVPPGEFLYGVMWSPDPSQLAYTIQIGTGKIGLDLVNRDGSSRRRVRTASTGFAVSWSPDSRRLVFSEQAAGKGYQPGHVSRGSSRPRAAAAGSPGSTRSASTAGRRCL